MGDLENGLWGGKERYNPNLASVDSEYVTAMLKGGAKSFAIKFGDATSGNLTTGYDGPRPDHYQPMKKQGAILLGIVRERPLTSIVRSAIMGSCDYMQSGLHAVRAFCQNSLNSLTRRSNVII